MHADGLSYRLIARNVGLSKNTVMDIVRRGSVERNSGGFCSAAAIASSTDRSFALRREPCRETGNHLTRQKPRKIRPRWPVLTHNCPRRSPPIAMQQLLQCRV